MVFLTVSVQNNWYVPTFAPYFHWPTWNIQRPYQSQKWFMMLMLVIRASYTPFFDRLNYTYLWVDPPNLGGENGQPNFPSRRLLPQCPLALTLRGTTHFHKAQTHTPLPSLPLFQWALSSKQPKTNPPHTHHRRQDGVEALIPFLCFFKPTSQHQKRGPGSIDCLISSFDSRHQWNHTRKRN